MSGAFGCTRPVQVWYVSSRLSFRFPVSATKGVSSSRFQGFEFLFNRGSALWTVLITLKGPGWGEVLYKGDPFSDIQALYRVVLFFSKLKGSLQAAVASHTSYRLAACWDYGMSEAERASRPAVCFAQVVVEANSPAQAFFAGYPLHQGYGIPGVIFQHRHTTPGTHQKVRKRNIVFQER